MAINITSILNAINAKNNNADSTYSNFELSQINKAVNTINSENGVITYNSVSDLPSGDSALIGQIAFVDRPYSWQDSDNAPVNARAGSFYYYNGDSWGVATLASDSSFANAAGGAAQGTNQYGISFGFGIGTTSPAGWSEAIEKYSFTSDENATALTGLMTRRGNVIAGQSSSTHGYGSGGRLQGPSAYSNIIEKIPFTVDENATDVGDLTVARGHPTGNQSDTHGYTSGGFYPPNTYSNVIDKFPFSTDANATDVGDLASGTGGQDPASTTSTTHGYIMGGQPASPDPSDRDITKFPFAAEDNSTDVGDLLNEYRAGRGVQSTTRGYHVGGSSPVQLNPSTSNIIEAFPFASDGNTTDVGDLIQRHEQGTATSSSTNGYTAGGYGGPTDPVPGSMNIIQKFPFSTDANATDVGDLTVAGGQGAGVQY